MRFAYVVTFQVILMMAFAEIVTFLEFTCWLLGVGTFRPRETMKALVIA